MARIKEPPESTKRIENCKLRIQDDICCNSKNYLRPHQCNGYCVEKVDQWLREAHPELDEKEIQDHVIRITQHKVTKQL